MKKKQKKKINLHRPLIVARYNYDPNMFVTTVFVVVHRSRGNSRLRYIAQAASNSRIIREGRARNPMPAGSRGLGLYLTFAAQWKHTFANHDHCHVTRIKIVCHLFFPFASVRKLYELFPWKKYENKIWKLFAIGKGGEEEKWMWYRLFDFRVHRKLSDIECCVLFSSVCPTPTEDYREP